MRLKQRSVWLPFKFFIRGLATSHSEWLCRPSVPLHFLDKGEPQFSAVASRPHVCCQGLDWALLWDRHCTGYVGSSPILSCSYLYHYSSSWKEAPPCRIRNTSTLSGNNLLRIIQGWELRLVFPSSLFSYPWFSVRSWESSWPLILESRSFLTRFYLEFIASCPAGAALHCLVRFGSKF